MKRFFSILLALSTLGFIIIIHESGHFIACNLYGVPVVRFSIGFGPVIASKIIGGTEFALSALPFGGYVSMDPQIFDLQPLLVKIIILLAGIMCNIVCATVIMMSLVFAGDRQNSFVTKLQHGMQSTWSLTVASAQAIIGIATKKGQERLQGPLGTIAATSSLLQRDLMEYLFVLASINMQIALFNLLPIPFFDGGQLAHVVIESTLKGAVPQSLIGLINVLFILFFILVIVHLTARDVRRMQQPDQD